jgi:hypothetical protein
VFAKADFYRTGSKKSEVMRLAQTLMLCEGCGFRDSLFNPGRCVERVGSGALKKRRYNVCEAFVSSFRHNVCACRSLDILKTSAAKQVKLIRDKMYKLTTSSPNFDKRCVSGCTGN